MPRLLAVSAVLTLLTACQPVALMVPGSAAPTATPAGIVFRAGQPVFSGHVMMPGWTVQATSGDVVTNALVTLTDAAGIPQAGGTTNAGGAFTLYPVDNGFAPVDGAFYTLDVSRRLASGAVLSLKTTVRLVGHGWTSITGSTIAVNLTTTAIALLDAADAAVTPEMTMGKVSGAGYTTVAAIGALTPDRIASQVAALTAKLTSDRDPGGSPTVTYTGDYTITDATTLANFTGFTAITGNLTVNAPGLAAITLPNLTTVTGDVTVTSQADLTSLTSPSLQTVTGSLTIDDNAKLTGLGGLGNLTAVGALTITNNATLTTLDLTALAHCTGAFTVTGNPALPTALATTLLAGLTTGPGSSDTTGNLP